GTDYTPARLYHRETGRFTTRDPHPTPLNKYQAFNTDPANGVDPSGNLTLRIIRKMLSSKTASTPDASGLPAKPDYREAARVRAANAQTALAAREQSKSARKNQRTEAGKEDEAPKITRLPDGSLKVTLSADGPKYTKEDFFTARPSNVFSGSESGGMGNNILTDGISRGRDASNLVPKNVVPPKGSTADKISGTLIVTLNLEIKVPTEEERRNAFVWNSFSPENK
ncbi:hypothetical protein, partial [Streptomyces sp. NRRL F-2664]|uniref:hypothetical protein n=1 Tax=Streptomyces sp. NRRL F-2664 TaxID=1463842 RepID=UPI00131CC314